ncbi:flavodoxin [Anaerotruncus colihominis]|uniref:Morphine 6-dehydrogenase n=1 Tax=Anaerotruncus colihominis TaxID=169435 RepID=A0A174QSX7_9FIRM|nr:aldo/keto reductase [Anaerotruncus colihominis]MCQ4734236.1 aldo/keto reductase [Anaerotruncus colihominis]CUP73970.1 Morphine 6-dehydrogenase [Anaerotruncus colihominis]
MKKKLLPLLLAVCTVLSLTMTACAAQEGSESETVAPTVSTLSQEPPFTDVPADAWYAVEVQYCYEHGIFASTSGTTFSPDDVLTRAMLVTTLYRAAGSPSLEEKNLGYPFSDVPGDSWYADGVYWARLEGVVGGYGNNTFGPDDPVTREQAVTILWRQAGSPAASAGDFSDGDNVADWAASAAGWALGAGLLTSWADDAFHPQAGLTRAEAAVLLARYQQSGTTGTEEGGHTLVAYFSATGTTRPLAEYAAVILNADLYEIVPAEPYTDADLDYYSGGRADQEQDDPDARPAISGSVADMEQYDTVLLGYPIWHGQAPRIISAFLESYDFTGKTIVPFCTSHSSGIGSSDDNLRPLAPGAHWLEGTRFAGDSTKEEMEMWINDLGLTAAADSAAPVFNFETRIVTINSGYEMPIMGLGTYSLSDEECYNSVTALLESGGRLIDTAYMYHNEAAVGRAIRDSDVHREEIFVITKLYPSQFGDAGAAIDEAVAKLDIGYIDMMLLHHPGTGDVEAYHAMEAAVADGKIRSLGLSNWYIEELEEFLPQVNITPALVQNEIHPYYQEQDVAPYIQSLGVVVQGWYPFGGRGHTTELLGDPVISAIAEDHGVTSAQVILRWNLQRGVVVIPGSSDPDHIRQNLDLFGFELTDAEMARIAALDRNEKHDWY